MKKTFVIKPITKDELSIPIEWAAKEGWNPGLHDLDSFYATDPKGFYMGFLNDEPISSISAVAYDKSFGFLGFYIVKPDYRGKQYGIKTWNEALKHLPTQNIGLDGVVDQQENYKKSGFKLAYSNIRYEGVGSEEDVKSPNIVPLSEIPFEDILDYDTKLFPTKRSTFLKLWIKQPEALAVGFVDKNKILGYGMVRKCRTGYKIGPLLADSETIANSLFQKMRSFVGANAPIFLDTPEVNKTAVQLAESYKMKPMFETARMYTKEAPKLDIKKIFGVTTFELG